MSSEPEPHKTRISGATRREVIERDGRTCQLCGRPVVRRTQRRGRVQHADNLLTLDHLVPISRGGDSSAENLRVCCRRCNMKRSAGGQL